ncbi:MAG: UDP-N-acetylmuramoylalanine--D-glutamate ligase [Candidatus Staskawiczbacteria bacterium RIFCSPHIGHO2_02_FULL_34_10]|uniref:Multifunctional fusion protein n=2 Tax=Candidatus Staskawicziibacteriota TaxID=1817916 RepID=A0A1G2HM56_9BACT|nr:MAG: UDP-N-acetylmuramoylalanine--D-glutamate ligase [Candidatus Staskawiczbacteria bacterium RIFCSPHIGHO2_01_FULL_34_27]OGZ67834.1 MAG: UDP-N-acetylmuramoylalanine--D-glutamate ligase [Candidatus Staskawiczbacteria bacterium RIFCSPHIGHO2_02_FULL_34_10]
MESKATIFEFTSYKFEPNKKRLLFNYKTKFNDKKPIFFTETILLPKIPNIDSIQKEVIDKLLESLHIMLGISYYKFYCATKFRLPYNLSKKEADFWNIVYKKGLGEFFYKNKLNPNILPKFSFIKNLKTTSYNLYQNDRHLVGVGGGKDSIVSLELLKQGGFDIEGFSVQTNKESRLIDEIINIASIKSLKIQRFLDSKVHQKHQYDGHIPISAIYAFLGIFTCVLYKYSYFIVSNEHSSSFGNINYKGLNVNHQWSKSFEFEKLFQNYIKEFISPDILYFSLLRSFYEIRIVKMFSKFKKYFSTFSSCNSNFRFNEGLWPTSNAKRNFTGWCGKCAKCVFVFTLLSAYLNKKDLISIFSKNLYKEKELLPLFKDILGFGLMKPFDCVGTFKEAQTALYIAKKNFKNDFIVRHFDSLRSLSADGVKYYKEVFQTNKENNIPEQFKLLGVESALILGYGKEGKVTEKYLKKYYSKIKIEIADAKNGKDYLRNQEDFDIAIKTPGIKKELIKIPHTTATNIFFSKVLNKNLIIGVTGSKGKSTTSSLIYEILKTADKNVEILGNIGKPMLEALLRPIPKDRSFVLELSSFQLDDIKFSPNIAVVTNLFEEHMDFHGDLKNYYNAKKNIVSFQSKNDFFVYNNKTVKWFKNYKGKAIPFSNKSYETSLIGEHNKSNINAAVSVAKILNIKDNIIKKAIKNFKGLPHRLEFIGEFKGIKFYDDAISTTPESTIMAIKSLKNIDTIFLGGQDRGYNFSQLEKVIKKYKIRNIVLFPNSGNKILKSHKSLNIFKTNKMEKAVKFAYKNTRKGSICLLSCASPSYSLWKNFEEKGGQFNRAVKNFAK